MKILFEFKVEQKYMKSFLQELQEIQNFAKKNTACSIYEYIVTDSSVFILEEWATNEHLDVHRSSSQLKVFREKVGLYLKCPRTEYLLTPNIFT